jgi:hypothetical protein
VIALQPDFEQIPEPSVRRNVCRAQMGVVVDDRLGLGVLMIETAAGCGAEKKIVAEERTHLNNALQICLSMQEGSAGPA